MCPFSSIIEFAERSASVRTGRASDVATDALGVFYGDQRTYQEKGGTGMYRRGNCWYSDFIYHGERYFKSHGPVSKSAASEKDRKFRTEVADGKYARKKTNITFDKLKELYLEWSKVNKRPLSYVRDQCSLKHLTPHFKGKRLSNISPFMVEQYKTKRKKSGAQAGTINRELSCLKAMFNKAIKWGRAFDNPVSQVKMFKENNEKMMVLSSKHEAKMLEEIRRLKKSEHLEEIVVTALNTGLRKRELLDLTWGQVNFSDRYLLITKTKNGEIRKIPMNKVLTETLHKLKNNGPNVDYVFPNKNGKPYTDVKTSFKRICKEIGIPEFRFHDLRHTFATRLVMAGVDLATVKELLGHKDIKMTMRYAHPSPEHKRQAVELLQSPVNFHNTPQKANLAKVVSIENH